LGYEPVGAEHGVTGVRITHIGGPTALIQADGWSLLTDPTFDDPGPLQVEIDPEGRR
jgi:L-ascorbate metabolism protein UlaG (beta-lactamase superfamily)